jgi:hypothetical protein
MDEMFFYTSVIFKGALILLGNLHLNEVILYILHILHILTFTLTMEKVALRKGFQNDSWDLMKWEEEF